MKTYDASSGLAFMVPQLAHIETKVFEKLYKAINYAQVIPVTNEAGEYATSIIYYYMDGKTVAKLVGSKSLNVPIAEIGETPLSVAVELGATGYEFSDEELRQAMHLNISLSERKASVARRGYEELCQSIAMVGDTTHNLPGFVDNTNVTSASVVNPGSGTEFVNKTPLQILFDINDLFGDIFVDTLQVEKADTLGLPTAQWSYIAGTPMSADNASNVTILKWLVTNSPYLNSEADVIPLTELTGAGAGSTDRMVAYTKDPDKVIFHIPMPLRFTEPQRKGRGFEVPGEFKVSGVEFRYPGSARYADGI